MEAPELRGTSERTFRRWARRYESGGEAGLTDGRLGRRRAGHAVPEVRGTEVARLYRTRYAGLTSKHFHEYLVRDHGFLGSHSWTKSFLQSEGLMKKAPAAARTGANVRAVRWLV